MIDSGMARLHQGGDELLVLHLHCCRLLHKADC